MQFNSDGSTARWKGSRRLWRDYKFGDNAGSSSSYSPKGFWGYGADSTYGTVDDVIQAPDAHKTFEGECSACHFTRYKRMELSGEYRALAANNADGEADIDSDLTGGEVGNDEMNVGCEACHGPGSDHVAANWARYVVVPRSLQPERANLICGRRHDRPKGAAANEQTIDATNYQMMLPGQSRATFVSTYCSSAQKGPKPKTDSSPDVWGDDVSSKSHHQQYLDHIKSQHYKNDRILVACSDCHEPHGGTPYRHQLVGDPDSATSGVLCVMCHNADWAAHTLGHAYMNGFSTRCIDCHMPKTAQSGSGRFGGFRTVPDDADGSPTWYTTDALERDGTYMENDLSSHVYRVPGKTHVSVAGVNPRDAMPSPAGSSGRPRGSRGLRRVSAQSRAAPEGSTSLRASPPRAGMASRP